MGYKSQYAKARRKEDEQYRQWKEDYAASKERYQEALAMGKDLKTSVLSQYDQLTDQDKVDFQRSQEAALAAQNQALASRGLSGSSIANNAYAGNARETAYGMNRLSDQRLQGRLGWETGLTADQINLMQAGPTAPSTAMYQATVQNLQAAMNYKLAEEARADRNRGQNMSWSNWLSNYMAPGAVMGRVQGATGMVAGSAMGGSLTPGQGAAMASNIGNNSYMTQPSQSSYGGYNATPASSSGYAAPVPQYGSATSAMNQGQGGSSIFQGQPTYQTNRI